MGEETAQSPEKNFTGCREDFEIVLVKRNDEILPIRRPLPKRDPSGEYVFQLVRFGRKIHSLIRRGWEEVGLA